MGGKDDVHGGGKFGWSKREGRVRDKVSMPIIGEVWLVGVFMEFCY